MTCTGYVWGGAFALGLGVALVGGAGAASADPSDGESRNGRAAAANSHSTSTASSRRSVAAKPAGARVSAVPKGVLRTARAVGQPRLPALDPAIAPLAPVRRSEHQARSLRTAAAVPSGEAVVAVESAGITWADLPPSYDVDTSWHAFRDGSQNVKVTSVFGAQNPEAVEYFYLHSDGDKYVAYTRLYLNRNVHVPASGGGTVKAFDPDVFPSDFGLTEITAGPPRRVPNPSSERSRQDLSTLLSWIPIVGQVVGTVNLIQDIIELNDAQRRGDIDDIADEWTDIRDGLVFRILGVQQPVAVAALAAVPVAVPVIVGFGAIYVGLIASCNASPGSDSCWALF